MQQRIQVPSFFALHPLISFSLFSLLLTTLFFYRAPFFAQGYSGSSNLFNDSMYRSLKPEGWQFVTSWDHAIYWQFLPWELFSAQSLRDGEIPLWNPYSGAGSPLLANWQSTIFAPMKLPLYFFPSAWMFEIILLLKVWLGSLFVFIFCRSIKMSGIASTVSALSFGFGGSIISCLRLFELNTLFLSPLFFMAVHRLSIKPSAASIAWTSLTTALLILSGHPEATIYTFLGVGIYAAALGGWGKVLRRLFYLLLALVGGALISSATLLPFLEMLFSEGFSYRSHALGESGPLWGLPVRLGSLVLPVPVPSLPDSYFLYIGVISLAFSIYSLKNYRKHIPLLAVLLLGAGFVIKLPPLSLLEYLPGLKHFSSRYAIGLVAFPLAMMAGWGLEMWQGRRKEKGLTLRLIGIIIFVILSVIAVSLSFVDEAIRPWKDVIYLHLVLGLFFSLVVIIIGNSKKAYYCWIIVPVLTLDLFLAGAGFNHPGDVFNFPESNAIKWLKNIPGIFRVMGMEGANNIPNTGMIHHISDVRVIDPLFLQRYVGFVAAIDPNAFFSIGAIPRVVSSPLWDLLNVRFLIRCRCRVSGTENEAPGIYYSPYPGPLRWHTAPPPPAGSFKKAYEDDNVVIYENLRAFHRAFIVHDAILTGSPKESLQALRMGGIDFRKKAIIEVHDDNDREKIEKNLQGIKHKTSNSAEIIKYNPMSVTIKAKLATAAVLILGDAYYPGWRAIVDGAEARIFPANYLLRGVLLKKGEHTVEFVYRPLSFRLGAVISLLSLIFVFVALKIKL